VGLSFQREGGSDDFRRLKSCPEISLQENKQFLQSTSFEFALLLIMLETRYYQMKAKILELATAFMDGDEDTRNRLRAEADFFPISKSEIRPDDFQSLMIRKKGELFLVEDTKGGEKGVFALLHPMM